MSKRRLTLTIDAEADTCGACEFMNDELPDRPECDVFGWRLEMPGPKRASRCVEAEDAARSWQGSEDDDDPVPHHLQEKP